jgi:hypothetical protein
MPKLPEDSVGAGSMNTQTAGVRFVFAPVQFVTTPRKKKETQLARSNVDLI